jgi:hypothetical protein
MSKQRYNFKGFTFGNAGDFNLIIETSENDFGYNTKFEIELSPEERQELITILIKGTTTKDGN